VTDVGRRLPLVIFMRERLLDAVGHSKAAILFSANSRRSALRPADTAPRGAAGGGWRKPDFQSVRGPSLGMPVGNCLLSARKTVMLTMPQAIDSEVPDPEEWMS
jgi:hypothetical protein